VGFADGYVRVQEAKKSNKERKPNV
jgi:hypothetical protein